MESGNGPVIVNFVLRACFMDGDNPCSIEKSWEYALFEGLVDYFESTGDKMSAMHLWAKEGIDFILGGLDLNDRICFLTPALSTSK